MKVELIAHTPEPEKVIATAAKLCYSASSVKDLQESLTDEKIKSFLEMLMELGHESPVEHVSFTFAIEGISRSCSHQLVRHRIASYSQQSQRYVNMTQFDYIIPPEIHRDQELKDEYDAFMSNIQKEYDKLVNALTMKHYDYYINKYTCDPNGEPVISEERKKELRNKAKKRANEDARYVLPNACETKIMVTMNIRSLYNFFNKRMCERAQWEIRKLAHMMWNECMKVSPTLFKYAGPSCINGKCPEGKMSCGLGAAIKSTRETMLKELYES
jgi:thymidylate synthase (FAD)